MTVNWPPPQGTYPAWPPPEFIGDYAASDWPTLLAALRALGFTHAAPTASERSTFFNSVRCGDNHAVAGRMIISPDGARRYPFAACNNAADRECLVLWPPYSTGWQSGPANF